MSYYQHNNPKRQKLVRDSFAEAESFDTPLINDWNVLGEKLQEALLVEHFTIPPYLCALYSIKDGTNKDAVNIIKTVVMEEMLHMIMVANLMTSMGFKPDIMKVLPTYPNPIPNSSGDFNVSLMKFSKESINTFLRIERPTKIGGEPQIDDFHSIGQFYHAIGKAIKWFEDKAQAKGRSIFNGTLKNQILSPAYYGGGGAIINVIDLVTAKRVLDEIVGQGEGIDNTIESPPFGKDENGDDIEIAHYFRFNQIFHGKRYQAGDRADKNPTGKELKVDWDGIYNMKPNPKMEDFNEYPWLLEKVIAFNKTYMKLLRSIQDSCNGTPLELDEKGIPLMWRLREQAEELMKIPCGEGNYTAGPTFEYVPYED